MRGDVLTLDDRLIQEGHEGLLARVSEGACDGLLDDAAAFDEGESLMTSGATTRTPGTALIELSRFAGRSLKTGESAFSRTTIRPWIWPRVSPTRLRMPPERLKRPKTPRIGIDRPIKASAVRKGRVVRLSQANRSMLIWGIHSGRNE